MNKLLKPGVRQIAILADDAGNVGGANYTKTLTDMTSMLVKCKKHILILKLTLPFCTQEYMYNGESYYQNFRSNIQIVMTGGRVWGEVTDNFTTTLQIKLDVDHICGLTGLVQIILKNI